MSQLTFGLMSGVEKAAPYAEGDILVHKSWGRVVVRSVERDAEAREPEVLLCTNLSNGTDCIAFPREIQYRSR
jgi:hypothetical protein